MLFAAVKQNEGPSLVALLTSKVQPIISLSGTWKPTERTVILSLKTLLSYNAC